MQLQSSALRRNTILALFVILSLSALDNAILHLTFIASAALALIYLAIGRLAPRLEGAIGLFVALSALYFFIHVAYFLLHYGTYFTPAGKEWSQPLKHIIFVLPFFVAARLAVLPGESLLRTAWIASAAWGLVTLPIALYQGLILGMRVEAGTGNAIPFAAMGAIFSSLALLGLNDTDKRYRWLAVAVHCVCEGETRRSDRGCARRPNRRARQSEGQNAIGGIQHRRCETPTTVERVQDRFAFGYRRR